MSKPIVIKEGQEFVIAGNVYMYYMNDDHKSFAMKAVRKVADGKKTPAKSNSFIPPTLDEVKAYFKEKGYTESKAVQFFEYYAAGSPPWSDGKGTPLRSWKQKALSVWFREEDKIQEVSKSLEKNNNMNGMVI